MNAAPSEFGSSDDPTTKSTPEANITDSTARRLWFIRHRWTIACLDLACVNCTCGRSRERGEDGNGYDLIA
jgi:hypothetical protein